MAQKVLVHDDSAALDAERAAMYTGRAEAWKHGRFSGPVWTEVDMKNAYVTIGAECELPRKLHMRVGKIQLGQYRSLCDTFAVLVRWRASTTVPVLPYPHAPKTH